MPQNITPVATYPFAWTCMGGGDYSTPTAFLAQAQQYVDACTWLRTQWLSTVVAATSGHSDPGIWTPGPASLPIQDATIGGYDYELGIVYALPHALDATATIAITVPICGASGHAALPSILPMIALYTVPTPVVGGSVTAPTVLTTATDASGSTGVYQTWHQLTISYTLPVAEVARFRLVVWGEGGTNYVSGLTVGDITFTRTLA